MVDTLDSGSHFSVWELKLRNALIGHQWGPGNLPSPVSPTVRSLPVFPILQLKATSFSGIKLIFILVCSLKTFSLYPSLNLCQQKKVCVCICTYFLQTYICLHIYACKILYFPLRIKKISFLPNLPNV